MVWCIFGRSLHQYPHCDHRSQRTVSFFVVDLGGDSGPARCDVLRVTKDGNPGVLKPWNPKI